MAGLLDTLNAQTDEGRQLRGGLLNMSIGLLNGSTGNYGQFAPALAQGFAGFQQGQQQVIDDKFKKAQTEQMQAYRNMQMQSMAQEQQQQQEAQQIISSGIDPQTALRHANPHVREWASSMANIDYRERALNARGAGGMSGLVPTTQGYAYRDDQGNTQFLTGPDGKPLMPVSAVAHDPYAQGNVAYSKRFGSEQAEKDANFESNRNAAFTALQGTESQLDRLLSSAEQIKNHKGLSKITGWMGMFPNIPDGKGADAQALLDTLKSQIGFTVLQTMRDMSKTGGALGSVSDNENKLLQNNLAALHNSQSLEQFTANLDKIISFVNDSKGRLRDAYSRQYGSSQNAQSALHSTQQAIPQQAPQTTQPTDDGLAEELKRRAANNPSLLQYINQR